MIILYFVLFAYNYFITRVKSCHDSTKKYATFPNDAHSGLKAAYAMTLNWLFSLITELVEGLV